MTSPEYRQPETVEEAIDALGHYDGEAKIIAGGQSLLILLTEGLVQPSALVALRGIADLGQIDASNGALTVGANVTHQRVHRSPLVREQWPLLAEAAGSVATVQVRNSGTLCGSLAHGFPLSDPPAALLALDAEAIVSGPSGERTVPLDEFFLGFLSTELAPDEVLTQVRVPSLPARSGGAYETLRARPLDFPAAGVAARVTLGDDGVCREARVALVGGGPTPMRARAAESLLQGQTPTDALLDDAAHAVETEAEPAADLDGSEAYKRRVLGVLTRRTLRRAIDAARANGRLA